MILNSGEEERRNDERSEELAKATNELASEEFLRSKNPTRTGKYIYKSAAFKDKKHFTIYCEARNVVPSLVGVLFLISEKVYLYMFRETQQKPASCCQATKLVSSLPSNSSIAYTDGLLVPTIPTLVLVAAAFSSLLYCNAGPLVSG